MGLASYTPPNDGTEIKAKHLRDLWIALSAQVNGNLNGDNFANGSIDYAKLAIAAGDIDGDKLTDESVGSTKLEDGAVTPERLLAGSGTTWVWQSWTPTLTNLSGGTLAAKYCQIGKTVFYRFSYVLGGAGVAGNVAFTLPVTSVSYSGSAGIQTIGFGRILDTGTATFEARAVWGSTTSATIAVYNASSTYLSSTTLSSTVPMTWAANDEIHIVGFYEAA